MTIVVDGRKAGASSATGCSSYVELPLKATATPQCHRRAITSGPTVLPGSLAVGGSPPLFDARATATVRLLSKFG